MLAKFVATINLLYTTIQHRLVTQHIPIAMETGTAQSATSSLAAARPEPLAIPRGKQSACDDICDPYGGANVASVDENMLKTLQKIGRLPRTSEKPCVPLTPTSAGHDTSKSPDEHEGDLLKRKWSSSSPQDADGDEKRSSKLPRITVDEMIDEMVDEKVRPYALKNEFQIFRAQQDALVNQEVPALRTATNTCATNISDLTHKSDERFTKHTQQLQDMTARQDDIAGTVSEHTKDMKANTTKIVKLEKSAKDSKSGMTTLQTRFRNHESDTRAKIQGMEGQIKGTNEKLAAHKTYTHAELEILKSDTVKQLAEDLSEHAMGCTERLEAHKTSMGAKLQTIKTVDIQDLRNTSTKLNTDVKDLQTHMTTIDEALDNIPKEFTDVQNEITVLDRTVKTKATKTEVQSIREAQEQSEADWKANMKSSEEMQEMRWVKVTTDLATEVNAHAQMQSTQGAKIKSCEDGQAGLTEKPDVHSKELDHQKAIFGRYDDRLNHITKDHLAFQVPADNRLSDLETSHTALSAKVSIVCSGLQGV